MSQICSHFQIRIRLEGTGNDPFATPPAAITKTPLIESEIMPCASCPFQERGREVHRPRRREQGLSVRREASAPVAWSPTRVQVRLRGSIRAQGVADSGA